MGWERRGPTVEMHAAFMDMQSTRSSEEVANKGRPVSFMTQFRHGSVVLRPFPFTFGVPDPTRTRSRLFRNTFTGRRTSISRSGSGSIIERGDSYSSATKILKCSLCWPFVVKKCLCLFLASGLVTTARVHFMIRLRWRFCKVPAFMRTAVMTRGVFRL